MHYIELTDYTGIPNLTTAGCGCCSENVELTEEIRKEAIEDAERFIAELKAAIIPKVGNE